MTTRTLNDDERRLIADALMKASKEARMCATAASGGIGSKLVQRLDQDALRRASDAHAVRAQKQERLASEIATAESITIATR